jgi:hypothetical protein
MLITIRSIIFAMIKGAAWLGLAGGILWQVALHSGTPNGIAYIHVPTPSVDITVDDAKYHVETLWDSPIVCELRPGNHVLRMSRSGELLFEQEFSLDRGKEIVLTAWEEHRSETPAASLAAAKPFQR